MTLMIDAHEDLAWNMVNLQRDYTRSALAIRKSEQDTPIPAFNGRTLLGWPQYQAAQVAIVFGTLFCSPKRLDEGKYPERVYQTPDEAHDCYWEQLDAYRRLVGDHPDYFRLIDSGAALEAHWREWETHQENEPPVGIVVLMEGAEGIREPDEVEQWFEAGVRIIGPAWAGNQYVGGTREPGPLSRKGYQLLDHMADLGMILDISHMDYLSALQALDSYRGQVIASHSNAEALIRGISINRHLKDDIIRKLIERDGVMGIVFLNAFLDWTWREAGGRQSISIEKVADQMDYVCQLAGNSRHVAIGTDFDGGFGVDSVPHEIDTIADLPLLVPLLAEKGYNQDDIELIFGRNWLRILRDHLPSG